MARRRQRRRSQEEVELNLAAMLDMAFQLLAFFILTFNPPAVEGQILLRMPPPQSMVVASGKSAGEDVKSTDPLQGLETLPIQIAATADGRIQSIGIGKGGERAIGNNMAQLDRTMKEIIGDPKGKFTQVLISVDGKLKYEHLMKVVDVCTRQKLPDGSRLGKLTFIESGVQ